MNKLILIGNLTRDPELKTTPSGLSVCDFTIAVNGRKKEDETQYFRVTVWRALGETCAKYLSKGKKVFVSGAVSARTYQANDGTTRVSLEVTADDVEFLSSKDDGAAHTPAASKAPSTPSGFTPVQTEELPF